MILRLTTRGPQFSLIITNQSLNRPSARFIQVYEALRESFRPPDHVVRERLLCELGELVAEKHAACKVGGVTKPYDIKGAVPLL